MVTHDPIAASYADRVVFLADGKIVDEMHEPDGRRGPRPHEALRGLTMLKLSLKTVLARKRRLVLTALSVMIGIAFLAGTFVFTDTIQRTFDNLFADVYKNTDAFVRSAEEFDLGFGQTHPQPASRGPRRDGARRPGRDRRPRATSPAPRVIVGTDGKPLGNEQGAPRFGQNVYGGELSPWVLAEGRLPGPDELVVDRGSFKKGDFALGDQVTVVEPGRQPAVHRSSAW